MPEDGKTAEKDLAVARLSLTLDFPVFRHEVLENPDEACDGAISQFIDKAVDVPIVAQRQIRMNWKLQKTIEIPQLRQTDQMVDVPVVLVAQVPQVRVVMKTVETPQLPSVVQAPRVQIVAETIEIPQLPLEEKIVMIAEIQTVQGPQTSESFREILMRGVAPNTEADFFIDDLSSVGSKGLNHQDCEVLFHAGMKRTMKRITHQPDSSQQLFQVGKQSKQSPDISGGVHVDRDDLHAMLTAEGVQQPHGNKQHHGSQQQQATNKQRQQTGRTEEGEKEKEEMERRKGERGRKRGRPRKQSTGWLRRT